MNDNWKPSTYRTQLISQVKTFEEGRTRWEQYNEQTYEALVYFSLIDLNMDVYEKMLKQADVLIEHRKQKNKKANLSSPFEYSMDRFVVAKDAYVKSIYNDDLNKKVKQFLRL